MARFFVQCLTICNNENLPNSNFYAKMLVQNFAKYYEYALKKIPKTSKISQGGEISPNLVTLIIRDGLKRGDL